MRAETGNGTLRSIGMRFLLALFVSVLLLGPRIGNMTDEWNRFDMHWEFADGLAVVLMVVLMGSVAVAIDLFLRSPLRSRRLETLHRFFAHLFLVAFGTGLLTLVLQFVPKTKTIMVVWGIMLGAVAFIYYRRLVRPFVL